ncbi:MAG: hypothetical protein JSW66_04815 [Phycisphaerales bacterium]|nr:MAG: hypothetical protein JSW66_04815 [Phycisphaerales bacterium]
MSYSHNSWTKEWGQVSADVNYTAEGDFHPLANVFWYDKPNTITRLLLEHRAKFDLKNRNG